MKTIEVPKKLTDSDIINLKYNIRSCFIDLLYKFTTENPNYNFDYVKLLDVREDFQLIRGE